MWGPAVGVVGGIAVAGVLVWTLIWRRDLRVLSAAVRRVGDDPGAGPFERPWLAGNLALARDIEHLARERAVHAARLGQMQRADVAVVERLPDPLIVLNTTRAVLRANAAARASFGSDIAAVLRHPELRDAIERAYARHQTQSVALRLAVPMTREVQAIVVPMEPPLADGGTALVLLSDRSQERALERMRADFVANASHELRTPLASLIGFVDTLRGPAADDPAAQARFLGIMAEQGARMSRLIDDLLSLSRVELSEHQPPQDSVDLAGLAARVMAGFEPRLRERGGRFDLVMAPGMPPVLADADQLAQVLQNLIDNGFKYGAEAGTVHVGIRAVPPGGSWPTQPGVVVSVRDEGVGIPREHLPRLTERFYRVDKGRSRAVGGTGLGLAIVKHIVNRHRGQLRIESEEGKGTTVSVWLPQAPPQPE